MNAVQGISGAGTMRVMVTHDGAHSAEDWARITSHQFIEIDPSAPAARQDAAMLLRAHITNALRSVFRAVKPTSGAAGLDALTRQGMSAVAGIASQSPWAMEFGKPEIVAMLEQTLRRNLFTAADIALRTE